MGRWVFSTPNAPGIAHHSLLRIPLSPSHQVVPAMHSTATRHLQRAIARHSTELSGTARATSTAPPSSAPDMAEATTKTEPRMHATKWGQTMSLPPTPWVSRSVDISLMCADVLKSAGPVRQRGPVVWDSEGWRWRGAWARWWLNGWKDSGTFLCSCVDILNVIHPWGGRCRHFCGKPPLSLVRNDCCAWSVYVVNDCMQYVHALPSHMFPTIDSSLAPHLPHHSQHCGCDIPRTSGHRPHPRTQ